MHVSTAICGERTKLLEERLQGWGLKRILIQDHSRRKMEEKIKRSEKMIKRGEEKELERKKRNKERKGKVKKEMKRK